MGQFAGQQRGHLQDLAKCEPLAEFGKRRSTLEFKDVFGAQQFAGIADRVDQRLEVSQQLGRQSLFVQALPRLFADFAAGNILQGFDDGGRQ